MTDDNAEKYICGRCFKLADEVFPAPCDDKPELLAHAPIGMFHCFDCGAMLIAGVPHPPLCEECLSERLDKDVENRGHGD